MRRGPARPARGSSAARLESSRRPAQNSTTSSGPRTNHESRLTQSTIRIGTARNQRPPAWRQPRQSASMKNEMTEG